MLIGTKPVYEFRPRFIHAAVRRNDSETGVRYKGTLNRLFMDSDQWNSTQSCGRDYLLLLAKVTDSDTFLNLRANRSTTALEAGKRAAASQDKTLRVRRESPPVFRIHTSH